jgi:hypothetical protein
MRNCARDGISAADAHAAHVALAFLLEDRTRSLNLCQGAPLIRVDNQDYRLDALRHTSQVDGYDFVEPFFFAIPLVAAVLDDSVENVGLIVVASVQKHRAAGVRACMDVCASMFVCVGEFARCMHNFWHYQPVAHTHTCFLSFLPSLPLACRAFVRA